MDLDRLEKIIQTEKSFRLKQIRQAIFKDLIASWDEATTLPVELRKKLAQEYPLEIKAEVFLGKDKRPVRHGFAEGVADGSAKALITLADGLSVETVLMRHQGRNTVCVSSQIGCPLGCLFCATGKMGFKRNLTAGEIMEQVLFWARYHRLRGFGTDNADNGNINPLNPQKISATRGINNVVFMGMGEPFLNYDNVFEAIKILNDDNLLGIGARHISISTAGLVEGIERMAEDMPQINLAISLHAPNDQLRQKLMPIAKKYPLTQVMATARDYVAQTNRKLMFEYIMIKNVNDSVECAKELTKLLNNRLYFVNLIVYNQTGDFIPSEPAQVKKFKDSLMKAGLQALERYRFGQEIRGACGQLAGQ